MRGLVSLSVVVLLACGESDADYSNDVASQMHEALTVDLHQLVVSAQALQDAAPVTQGRGWDAQADFVAIAQMKNEWLRARAAYEHVEGAVAPMFPNLDVALDSRYEELLAGGDAYAFDDQGVVGLDAIERVVWSDVTPSVTIAYEGTLPGYAPARFPATEQEAADFKNVLCAKLVADAKALEAGWNSQAIDVKAAYGGLIALMTEQRDEIAHATLGSEESRYSQTTLNDLRSNVEGVEALYGIFRPWIATKHDGGEADQKIEAGFAALDMLYAATAGDALPPATSGEYIALAAAVTVTVDPNVDGSLTNEMARVGALLDQR
ncbi:MAG TPA: imelysin family protein [Polyangiaceae bacterium]